MHAHTYTRTCTCTHMHTRTHTCPLARLHAGTNTLLHACWHTCTHPCLHACTHTGMHAHMHTCCAHMDGGRHISASELKSLHAVLLKELHKSYPSLGADDVVVAMFNASAHRRLLSGRAVIKITIIQRQGSVVNVSAAADSIVTSFEDGSIHKLLPLFPVAHAQRTEIGEWTCWCECDIAIAIACKGMRIRIRTSQCCLCP